MDKRPHSSHSPVRPLPVSKWELKAKLGLKNAEDMTITCRAKTILLGALQKTAQAWTRKGSRINSQFSGAFEIQVTRGRSSNAQHFIPSHFTERPPREKENKNPAQPSSLEDLETDVDILPHLLVFFYWQQNPVSRFLTFDSYSGRVYCTYTRSPDETLIRDLHQFSCTVKSWQLHAFGHLPFVFPSE